MKNTLTALAKQPAMVAVRNRLVAGDADTLELQARLSAIPSPTGLERQRGQFVGEVMREIGLQDVDIDEVGNVCGRLGQNGTAPTAVLAHLDTVFTPETDVTVVRDGLRLSGAGICDNARGLAGMLALARAMIESEFAPGRPILFAATVGEEGAGDLRGARHLFHERRIPAVAAVALDGAGDSRVVHRALGSRRYRFTFRGPGGHSWAAYGVVNPAHAAGRFASAVADLTARDPQRTACSVVRISGGQSLNTIPQKTLVEIDLRSEDPESIATLERSLGERARAAAAAEDTARTRGSQLLELSVDVVGDRPTGVTPADHPLVVAVIEATRLIGRRPTLVAASTDANVPMSLGIPAIAIGAGGSGGEAHLSSEWYENDEGPLGLYRAALVIAAAERCAS